MNNKLDPHQATVPAKTNALPPERIKNSSRPISKNLKNKGSEMPTLSLKKIFLAITGIIVLWHLKAILNGIQSIHDWFCDSLDGLRDFDEGAQVAIAVAVLILIVVLILRAFNKL